MQQSSLRSLREETPQDIPHRELSPHEKEEIKLGELRGEIELLTGKKNDLREDIDKLEEARQFQKDKLKDENVVRKLKFEKIKLLKQIKELSGIYFGMKEGQKKIEEKLGDVTSDRIKTLEYLGASVDNALKDEASRLLEKSERLGEKEAFWAEFANYYIELAEISESTASQNALRGVELAKELQDVLKSRKDAKVLERRARDLLEKANARWSEVDREYQEVHRVTGFFENEADREKSRLQIWAKTLEVRENKVEAYKRETKRFEKELDDREKWLDDRERTFARSMEVVKKMSHNVKT